MNLIGMLSLLLNESVVDGYEEISDCTCPETHFQLKGAGI